jgi:hypothetical protein
MKLFGLLVLRRPTIFIYYMCNRVAEVEQGQLKIQFMGVFILEHKSLRYHV